MAAETLIQMLKRHEGFRATVYCDRCGQPLHHIKAVGGWDCGCSGNVRGNITVGYGQRVDGPGVTKRQGAVMLASRSHSNFLKLKGYAWFVNLDDARQWAIEDMAYTMGVDGVLEFKLMRLALLAGEWRHAAAAIESSKWATDEAPKRALEIANIIRTGLMPDAA